MLCINIMKKMSARWKYWNIFYLYSRKISESVSLCVEEFKTWYNTATNTTFWTLINHGPSLPSFLETTHSTVTLRLISICSWWHFFKKMPLCQLSCWLEWRWSSKQFRRGWGISLKELFCKFYPKLYVGEFLATLLWMCVHYIRIHNCSIQ